MSSDAPTEKKPGWFRRLLTAPSRLTTPGCAAWIMAIVLVTVVIATWLVFYADPSNVRDALGWPRIVAVLVLLVLIPPVLYYGLRLWLEGDVSKFPDVDYAWRAGLDALKRNGVALDGTPVFLVLGSPGVDQELAFMEAAGLNLRVRCIPEGGAPLHWYASPDAVYIFCTQASWLSALAKLAVAKATGVDALASYLALRNPAQLPPEPRVVEASPPPPEPVPKAPAAKPAEPAPTRPRRPTPAAGGTIMLDDFLSEQAAANPSTPSAARNEPVPPVPSTAARRYEQVSGTIVPAAPESTRASYSGEGGVPASSARLAIVPTQDSAEQLQRLRYVCRLLREKRQPLCPVNGVLTLLPFDTVESLPQEVEELERAIRADLQTIQRQLQLRCPITVLVSGLERETGFRELVRRVGPERSAAQRFGRKFDVRARATTEELANLSAHVCGAFEDWVYALFREDEALTRPGNTRLYGLLCKVRCHLRYRLGDILSKGFGYDPQQTPNEEPLLFSGCYFAATGDTTDRQAFVRGVLEKMIEEQENVEWTQQALLDDRRHRWMAYAGFTTSALLLLFLAAIFFTSLK